MSITEHNRNWRHVERTGSTLTAPRASIVVRSPEGTRLTGLQSMTPARRRAAVASFLRIVGSAHR